MAGGDELICENSNPLQGLTFDGTISLNHIMWSKQN